MTEAPIPARMVNAFVYCPRLFYLEWVDGRFAVNDHVRIGRRVHARVDKEAGAAPLPDEGELKEARSITLSSDEIGVIARLDLLEGEDGVVVPVDFKKGRPQQDGTPWPSDEVQVCLQAILLREQGYSCRYAELWYDATRQRVRVEITDERVSWARSLVSEARQTADLTQPPLPLVDSPKCNGCSLVGLCLPDETNALLSRREHPPRKLVPRDPDQLPVYVTEPGSYVRIKSKRIEIISRDKEKLAEFRLIDVSHVAVFGKVQISTQALHEFFARDIPVLWLSAGGWLKGFAIGQPSNYVELRRRQVAVHAQGGIGVAQKMIAGKILNSRTLLRRNTRDRPTRTIDAMKRLAEQALNAETFATLLGIEGAAARLYFAAFPTMLSPEAAELCTDFSESGRQRRPPPDPLNALLSFCYSMLTKDLVATTLAVGLDPLLGVYHRARHARPALALDLAEEFRPLVADSVVLALLNNGEITSSSFIRRAGAATLTQDGRRTVLRSYERRLKTQIRHPIFDYRISYRRVLDVQARLLAAVIVGEIPDYTAMVTR
ncbi:CRISPR-associated endonuclease Cas1 [Actinobacteria bacterium YIM 96077]|uniref:CRISPR-associated endonuclease Cas1 n=1 Tax=Phytoactinopolyspora halophila TaxID=1981511 RepID=A0A329QI03_9ACTN|nr:CRISPR-associated endonuclease Cas1 [Phytoactinopolyspora halophila]AYY13995.1 CRISPR-associated endonuclease Cas1 [Actinobacteria bacterium YIM 96077]RAW10028.1 CRISPR-associated protein Cas1 [Phytoactinopolyspora halophila]